MAAGGRVQVFGDDYPTPDGTCIRDYIHVTDLADAHLRALAACRPGQHRVYNLGNGTGFSVRQVIDVCAEVTGTEIGVDVTARRPGDPAVLVASSGEDPGRARLAGRAGPAGHGRRRLGVHPAHARPGDGPRPRSSSCSARASAGRPTACGWRRAGPT